MPMAPSPVAQSGLLRFPMQAVAGPLSFGASRVHVWSRESTTGGGSVQQMFLSGDVQVRIGVYELTAARAVVWLEKLADVGEEEPAWNPDTMTTPPAERAGDSDRAGVYRVFIYFDRVASPSAHVSVSVQADRLPVRAVIDVRGPLGLTYDMLIQGQPSDPLMTEAEAALEASLAGTSGPAPSLRASAGRLGAAPSEGRSFLPMTAERLAARSQEEPGAATEADGAFSGPIFAAAGVLSVAASDLTLVTAAEENSLLVSGGLAIQYSDARSGRSLQLTAQRGVVFTEPVDLPNLARLRTQDVRGIYLEGDVIASDGQYTLRGPRVYYDLRANRAIVLDAVFWTYDQQRRLPLYVRADSIRQQSRSEFVAKRARLASSAFFEPDFSIGATSVTITRRQVPAEPEGLIPTVRSWFASPQTRVEGEAAGPAFSSQVEAGRVGRPRFELESDLSPRGEDEASVSQNRIAAENITLNAEGVPFFYWPSYEGTIDEPLLRDLRAENRSSSGFAIQSRWNAYRMLGLRGTPFTRADAMIDAYFSRGPGFGTILEWAGPDTRGNALMYGLFNDRGTDVLRSGARSDNDGRNRGLITVEHVVRLDEKWTFFGEFAYQSDANFVQAFYPQLAESGREFTSQAFVRRLDDNTAFFAGLKGTPNNFVTNEYLLQSQGYSVTKAPEIGYVRQADPLLSSVFGDLLTWSQEYRYSRAAMKFDTVTPAERGFPTDEASLRSFGLLSNQTFYDQLTAAGFLPQDVHRFDTRQEIDAKIELGPVNFVPFGVARLTAYDHGFETFSPDDTSRYRFWGSTGGTVSTQFQRVDNDAESRLFDINRIRHIVEPSATVYTSATNRRAGTLPVYDENIENLSTGTAGRVGVNQIWQTQRGRPGRTTSVDLFSLDLNYVNASNSTERRSPVGRFLDFRPELSSFGEYLTADGAWRATDATTLTGGTVYDLDIKEQARTSAGVVVQQAPDVTLSLDYRYLNQLDLTSLGGGIAYRFANQYVVSFGSSYDLTRSELQSFGAEVRRDFQSIKLGFNISRSLITDETRFGFSLTPRLNEQRGRIPILGEQEPVR